LVDPENVGGVVVALEGGEAVVVGAVGLAHAIGLVGVERVDVDLAR